MTPEERAAAIAKLEADGMSSSEAAAFVDSPAYGQTARGRKSLTALDTWADQALNDATNNFGQGVAKHLMSNLVPWLSALRPASDAQFGAARRALEDEAFRQLQAAMDADQADRHRQFQQYFTRTYAMPYEQGLGPTAIGEAAATRTAIAGLEAQYEAEYEQYYAGMGGGKGFLSNDVAITNFLYAKALDVVGDARPDLNPDNPTTFNSMAIIRGQVAKAGQLAQQAAVREKAFAAAESRTITSLNELGASLGNTQEDADIRLGLSDAKSLLYDPNLLTDFQVKGAAGLTADQYMGVVVGGGVQHALSGTRYAPSLVMNSLGGVDITGTVGAIKSMHGQETFSATVEDAALGLTPEEQAKLGKLDPKAMLVARNGDIAAATKDLNGLVSQAKIAASVEKSVAAGLKDANTFQADANRYLASLTPGERAKMGNVDLHGLAQKNNLDYPAALADLQAQGDAAKQAEGAAQANRGILDKNSAVIAPGGAVTTPGFDKTKFTPALAAKFGVGQPFTLQDALDLAHSHTSWGSLYSTAPSQDARYKTMAEQGDAAVTDLYNKNQADYQKDPQRFMSDIHGLTLPGAATPAQGQGDSAGAAPSLGGGPAGAMGTAGQPLPPSIGSSSEAQVAYSKARAVWDAANPPEQVKQAPVKAATAV